MVKRELISGVILVAFFAILFLQWFSLPYSIHLWRKGVLVLCFARSQSKHSHINVHLFTFRSKSSHLSVNKVKSDQCPQFLPFLCTVNLPFKFKSIAF